MTGFISNERLPFMVWFMCLLQSQFKDLKKCKNINRISHALLLEIKAVLLSTPTGY